jgi:hypothetical protein
LKKGWKRDPATGNFYDPATREQSKDSYIEPVDASSSSAADKARIRDLEARLAASEAARTAEQQSALDIVKAQGLGMTAPTDERPTGRTVGIIKCVGYKRTGFEHGRVQREPVFEEVQVPTFYYKVIMAACGGLDLKLNGQPFCHGMTYEVDLDTLRTMKDIVWRTWTHDQSVHGDSAENAYRKQNNPVLNARAY